jgi:hypothetical protein
MGEQFWTVITVHRAMMNVKPARGTFFIPKSSLVHLAQAMKVALLRALPIATVPKCLCMVFQPSRFP